MTPQQIDAMKLALEALELCNGAETVEGVVIYTDKEITAIKEALAEHAMRETQRLGQEIEQAPVAWRNAAIRVGEDLSSVGPDGYYDMTAQQWLDWAMEQQPHGKNSLAQPEQEPLIGCVNHDCDQCKAQRKPLTDAQIFACENSVPDEIVSDRDWCIYFARAIEAAHGIKE